MKSLKILAIVLMQLAVFAGSALAQTSQPAPVAGQRIEKMIEQMQQRLEKLNLSTDQKQKIQAIFQAQKQELQAWVQAHKADLEAMKNLPADQRRAAMQKLTADRPQVMKKFHDQLRDVLTPEQREQLAQSEASRPGQEGATAVRRMHQVLQQLNLTDDQKAKVKDILKAAHEKAQNAATPQEKKDILTQAMDNIKTNVLTKEQTAKLEELLKNAPGQKEPFADLKLTDDQKAQIQKVTSDARTQAQKASTPQEKRAIHRQAMEKILNTVLTADQKAQFLKEHPRTGKQASGTI